MHRTNTLPAILCQRAPVQVQTRSESPGATPSFPLRNGLSRKERETIRPSSLWRFKLLVSLYGDSDYWSLFMEIQTISPSLLKCRQLLNSLSHNERVSVPPMEIQTV